MKYLFFISIPVLLFACKPSQKAAITDYKNRVDGFTVSGLSDKENIAFEKLYFEGVKQKILGNTSIAQEKFKKTLEINPTHAASLFELAILAKNQKLDDQALAYAEKSAKIDPSNIWYQLLLAEEYDQHGEYEKSAKIYEALSTAHPRNLEYYELWANALIYANKLEKSLHVFDLIEEQMGVTEPVSLQKERIYLNLGKTDAAIIELQKLIKKEPNNSKFYTILADLYMMNEQEDKALEIYNELLEKNPDDAYAHITLSEYYGKKGDKKKSEEELKKAFSSKKLGIDAKIHHLLSFFSLSGIKEDKKELAFDLSKILVETHPKEAKSHSVYADFLYRDNKLKEAREQYKLSAELDQSKAIMWNQILLIDSELQDYNDMQKESDKALVFFPSQPSFYLFNGIAYMQLKRAEKAIKIFDSGKELVVDNPLLKAQFYANLGDSYHQLKNDALSDSSYEKCLSIDPNNVYVLNNYSYYLSLRNEYLPKAAEMSKKSNEIDPNSPSFMDTYGWILFRQEKYLKAKEWLFKAVAKSPHNGVILEHYGDVLYQLDEKEKALKYWLKAGETGQASKKINEKIENKKYVE